MTKITTFGRYEHQIVSAKVTAALKVLEEELGVKFTAGGGQIGQNGGRINLNVEIAVVAGGVSGAEAEFQRGARYAGMKPEHFGEQFWFQGTLYKVASLNLNAPKFPVNVIRVRDNKGFKMQARAVIDGIAAMPAKRTAA